MRITANERYANYHILRPSEEVPLNPFGDGDNPSTDTPPHGECPLGVGSPDLSAHPTAASSAPLEAGT